MRDRCRHRRGLSTVVIVLLVVVVFGLAMTFGLYFLKAMNAGNEAVNQNTCRANLRVLSMAMMQYDQIQGRIPGYVDVLRNDQGKPTLDPKTQQPLAVSWVVHLMPHLEHASTFEQWRQGNLDEPFIPVLVCPSDSKRSGPALSYVGNSGMPDAEGSCPDTDIYLYVDREKSTQLGITMKDVLDALQAELGGPVVNDFKERGRSWRVDVPADPRLRQIIKNFGISVRNSAGQTIPLKNFAALTIAHGIPRDWQANGIFFNTYSDDPAVSTDKSKQIPRIIMRSSDIRDPKDRTIVFTENVDTSTYTLPQADARSIDGGAGSMPEVRFGCVWGSETVQDGQPPVMTPPQGVWRPQQGIVGKSASHARPYSQHQGGFNAAFAAGNVFFLSDKLSYFVYAKLMASNDAAAKHAGTQELVDPMFRAYQIYDSEIHP